MESQNSPLFKFIQKIPFFDEFTNQEKCDLIENTGIFKKYDKKGLTIIKEGEKGDSMFLVIDGLVSITRKSFEQEKEKLVVLAKLKKGSVFGEISLLSNRTRITGAITDSSLTIVMEISKKKLEKFNPVIQGKFQTQLIATLVRRLDDLNARMSSK